MNYDYAKAIKQLREKMIISQAELAELLHVAFSTVSRWETGLFAPTIKAKRKLAPLFEKYNIVLGEK
jgi:transcriptional regulator with XRE-family HTH domain